MTVAIEPPRRASQPVGTLPPLNQRLLAAMGAEVLVIPSIAHARDLLRGTLPTTSGTMTMRPGGLLHGGEGLGLGYDESGADITGYWQYASRTAASARGNTFVGILVKTATVSAGSNNFAYWFHFGTSLNVGPAATTTYNNGTQFSFFFDSTQLGTSVNITIGVPYMIVASLQANGAGSAWYLKVRNLRTGAIDSNQSGTATYSGTGSSTWNMMGGSAFGKAWPGYMYLGAMGSKYLPPQIADEWIRNPWLIVDANDSWAATDAGAGGGGTFSVSVSEAISAADAPSAAMIAAATIAEAMAAADTITAAMSASAAIAEALAVADTPSGTVTAAGSVTESIAASDTPSASMTATGSLSESITAADTVSGAMSASASVSESITAADTVSGAVNAYAASVSESITAADTVTVAMSAAASVAESMTLLDAPSATMTATGAMSESISAADTVSGAVGVVSASIAEAISLSDAPSALMTASAAIVEAIAASDTASVVMSASRAVAEALSLADTVLAGFPLSASVSESISLVDVVYGNLGTAILIDGRYIITGEPRRFTITGEPRQFRVTH